MKLFSKLFKIHVVDVPEALLISDWLQNMFDIYLKIGAESLDKPNSPTLLACYTLCNTIRGTYNTLHMAPKSSRLIGKIFLEFRLYYDCIWQLTLLTKYAETPHYAKVSKLYPEVEINVESALKTVFKDNEKIAKLLEPAISD